MGIRFTGSCSDAVALAGLIHQDEHSVLIYGVNSADGRSVVRCGLGDEVGRDSETDFMRSL